MISVRECRQKRNAVCTKRSTSHRRESYGETGDNEIPQMPDLKSVSVDELTQTLVLNWVPSSSEDVYGYVVCAGNPCVALDTVWGADAYDYYCEDCSVE